MFPITFTINSEPELDAVLAVLRNKAQIQAQIVNDLKAPEAKKPNAPAASSPSGAKAQAEAKPAPVQEKATESAPAEAGEKTYTVDDAKALTMKLVASKGRDTAKGLLDKYGVPVAAKLPAEKVGEFCREAEGLLA